MKLAVNWKALKYLFWLGPILIIMGVTAGLVAGEWVPAPLGLIIAGGVLIGLWVVSESRSLPSVWRRRSTQTGTNVAIATIAVLVIVGLINFFAIRYTERIDLTENQRFTLAPQTQQVLENLDQPISIWIFDQAPNPIDRRLLNDFQRQTDLLTYEYVDPQLNPQEASRFGVQNFGEVYLESGDRQRLITTIGPENPLTERDLATGILQITSDRQAKVYFLQGHGEKVLEAGQNSISQAVSELTNEQYVAEPLNLAQNPTIPDDANVVVIAGPQRQLLDTEISALEEYLTRQSGLMLMIDPATDPGLEELLQEWTVNLTNRLIIDPQSRPPTVTIVTQYGDHPITQDFGNNISLFPEAQPLELGSETGEITATPLLLTGEQVQAAVIDASGQVQLTPNEEAQGSLLVGAALSRPVEGTEAATGDADAESADADSAEATEPEATEPEVDESADDSEAESMPEARLVVIGNSSFATDGLFNEVLNGDVFLNSVSWLSQQDEQILSIRSKEPTNRRLILNQQQLIVVALTAVAILPIVAFGGAIALWLKRR
jgi:ABC-type uncharacterized transport system involved in gliding motility auxiliary subunit